MNIGLFLLRQFLAHLDGPTASNLALQDMTNITPEILDRLRDTVLADTLHRGGGFAGLSISLDGRQLLHQVQQLRDEQASRAQCESLLRAGASQRLLTRLFGVSQQEVRQLRKMLVPTAARGGRPRQPCEMQCAEILAAWAETAGQPNRQRYLELARRFPTFSVVALEGVLAKAGRPSPTGGPTGSTRQTSPAVSRGPSQQEPAPAGAHPVRSPSRRRPGHKPSPEAPGGSMR